MSAIVIFRKTVSWYR